MDELILPDKKYATIVIDPPWELNRVGWASSPNNGISERLSYTLLQNDEIASLPVNQILNEDALLFCWTVNSHLTTAIQLLESWNIKYWFTMTWVKNGGIQLPNSPQFNAEWCIVGRKGKPQFLDTKMFNTANYWPRQGHSVKPEGFYDLLRRVTPGPRLDIFGRRRIAGFDSCGNEAPDGDTLPDHYQQVLLEAD